MKNTFKRHGIALLVTGLFLISCGLWFILNPQPVFDIPNEDPVVYLRVLDNNALFDSQIEVFSDGTIIYMKETEQRTDGEGHTHTRQWRGGMLSQNEVRELLSSMTSDSFTTMDECYICTSPKAKSVTVNESDPIMTEVILHVNCNTLSKTVTAINYPSQNSGDTYTEMPSPLHSIYERITYIGEFRTDELLHEVIDDVSAYH